MGLVSYTNAVIMVDGYEVEANFTEFAAEYGAETLDKTVFGYTARQMHGGLLTARMTGRGLAQFGTDAIEEILFNRVATDGTVIVVFPDGITEGTTTNMGYSMLGTIHNFTLGGAVGTLLPFQFEASYYGN